MRSPRLPRNGPSARLRAWATPRRPSLFPSAVRPAGGRRASFRPARGAANERPSRRVRAATLRASPQGWVFLWRPREPRLQPAPRILRSCLPSRRALRRQPRGSSAGSSLVDPFRLASLASSPSGGARRAIPRRAAPAPSLRGLPAKPGGGVFLPPQSFLSLHSRYAPAPFHIPSPSSNASHGPSPRLPRGASPSASPRRRRTRRRPATPRGSARSAATRRTSPRRSRSRRSPQSSPRAGRLSLPSSGSCSSWASGSRAFRAPSCRLFSSRRGSPSFFPIPRSSRSASSRPPCVDPDCDTIHAGSQDPISTKTETFCPNTYVTDVFNFGTDCK